MALVAVCSQCAGRTELGRQANHRAMVRRRLLHVHLVQGRLKKSSSCCHRRRARDFLAGVLGHEVEEEVDEELVDELDDMGKFKLSQLHILCTPSLLGSPPVFTLRDKPSAARCPCGNMGSPEKKTIAGRAARLHPHRRRPSHDRGPARTCRAQGQQHTIVPDLGEFGLYNWNNEIIVEHALFNDYSSASLLSPTTLSAFRRNVAHRYAESTSPFDMLPKSTFNRLFYSFAARQSTAVAFGCPECGTEPEDVICDGVYTPFAQRHRLATLSPPAVPHQESTCDDVRPPRDTPFLSTAPLRSRPFGHLEMSPSVRAGGREVICSSESGARSA